MIQKKSIEIDVSEARRVFDLLEKINDLFHQPMKYKDIEVVESFADDNYSEIQELYYNIVWKWFPDDIQEEIEDSE